MTDRMAALALLNDIDCDERRQALQDFHDQHQGDPLVLDKWFQLRATSTLPGTLGEVKALLGHPAFSLDNPNRFRALVGAFANANPLHFHREDGAGYGFVGSQILALEGLNPQVAARLLTTLGRWRRYDEKRQALMRDELEVIVNHVGLSRDVFEIASKLLA